METGDAVTRRMCEVQSNKGKQCIWAPGGAEALESVRYRITLRGTPDAQPDEKKGYRGGVLDGIKILGAYLGDEEWCSQQLVKRVKQTLTELEAITQLQDTRTRDNAQQAQQSLVRYCTNSTLVYFLRTMPPSVTIDAARLHDKMVADAFLRIVSSAAATERERDMALAQARLPVKLGGMGLTSMEAIRPSAWVGTWALVWEPCRRFHEPFRSLDITDTTQPVFAEVQSAHADLLVRHKRVAAAYDGFDKTVFDYCKEGLAHYQFHPKGLPKADQFLPLALFGASDTKLKTVQAQAQRKYSRCIHHAAWMAHWRWCSEVSKREAVRFISVSQLHAGDFLNAIPMRQKYRMPSWAMRCCVQRRLGLPISSALAAEARRSAKGKVLDPMGDVAQNDGRAGHAGRHKAVLSELVKIMRGIWGNMVEEEPENHLDYSNTYKPDVAIRGGGAGGRHYVGDVKFLDPLSSNMEDVARRGSYVAFGNTEPGIRVKVFGLKERGKGEGTFKPATGTGYVKEKDGDYAHAMAQNHDVRCLLFETFGGFGRDVERLFKTMAFSVMDKMSKSQYEDEASWSTRSWTALQCQRLSVVLHIAAATEIINELGYGDGEAAAGRRAYGSSDADGDAGSA